MKRFLHFKFLFIPVFLFPFFLTAPAGADQNLENTLITLNLSDTPTRAILREVEKQTNYTIEILDLFGSETIDTILNNKKSIILNQAPLDQAIKRLLKDVNYSIISNDKQRRLTLVLLNKENGLNDATSGDIQEAARIITMDDVTAAFEEFDSLQGRQQVENPEEQQETSMDAVTAAFEEFDNNDGGESPSSDDLQAGETSMDAVTAAFEELDNNDGEQPTPDDLQAGETSMDAVTAAFEEFDNRSTERPAPGDMQAGKSSMDAVTDAFDEFDKLNKSD